MTTHQQFFDNALFGIRAQKVPCINPATTSCMYRLGELKCALGFSIPDDRVFYGMDNKGLTDPALLRALDATEDDEEFLLELRGIHDAIADQPDFLTLFEPAMANFAVRHSLAYVAP